MKLYFVGAAHEVTGSCHVVEAAGKRFLIDCGMEQGRDELENQELPLPANQVDAVLLTHAHIDHTGMLPKLYANGFRGPVYATEATADLCSIMLRDSAHIQESDAQWRTRKALRAGKPPVEPAYTLADAEGVLRLFVSCAYGRRLELFEGVSACFYDAGHLLGSASIHLILRENGETRTVLFSGDIGNDNRPLLKDPITPPAAEYVITESTYGDRSHPETRSDYAERLAAIVQRTLDAGGNVIIPSFAVGRTQEMLYLLRRIKDDGMVKGHDGFEVYVDSPLAVEATKIFSRNVMQCFDEEALALVHKGINPIEFDALRLSVTAEDSKAINLNNAPKVILAASGMCEAGRVRHHLKHNLWRSESCVVFVGYQSPGTVGRQLLDGAEEVKLFGDPIQVHARIDSLEGVSGHADREGICRWIDELPAKPRHVFVVHGEEQTAENFEALLIEKGYEATAPYSGAEFDLLKGQWISQGIRKEIQRRSVVQQNGDRDRLQKALARLTALVEQEKNASQATLAAMAKAVEDCCDKFGS